MKKTTLLAMTGLVVLSLLAFGAFAYGQRMGAGTGATGAGAARADGVRGAYHEQMEQIMESGTYADLVALRAETGRQLMPFVTDEATFAAQQETHKQMVAQYGEGPRAGGCPMHQGVGGVGGRVGRGMGQGTGRGTGVGGGCAGAAGGCPFAVGDE